MKLAFLLLILVNIGLFAWHRGLLGPTAEAGREPQRIAQQIAAEKLRPLTPDQLAALRGSARPAAGGSAPKPACLQFGDFDDAELARVQQRLAPLGLGERLQAQRVEGPGWHIVFIPPLPSRADAERLAQDLRNRGVRDFVVMGENSPMRNGIALGSFRDQDLARRHAAEVEKRGVKGVRISDRTPGAEVTRFEIREVDAALAQQLAEIQKEYPQSQLNACEK